MRLKTFFLASSALLVSACGGGPKPPEGESCVTFNKGEMNRSYSRCYKFSDFDENGRLKPGVQEVVYPLDMQWLDRRVSMDPDSYADLKRYVLQWKARCEEKK